MPETGLALLLKTWEKSEAPVTGMCTLINDVQKPVFGMEKLLLAVILSSSSNLQAIK